MHHELTKACRHAALAATEMLKSKGNPNHGWHGRFAPAPGSRQCFYDMAIEQQRQIKQFLDGEPVVNLTGEEFKKRNRKLTVSVTEFFNNKYHGKATHHLIGDVELNEQGVKDSLAHGIGRNKAAAFAAVPEIIIRGVVVAEETNWKGRKYDSYLIAAPFRMAGEDYVGTVVVIKNKTMQRYYLHEVAKKEELRSAFKTGATSQTGRTTGAHGVPSIFKIPHDILNFNKSLRSGLLRKSLLPRHQTVNLGHVLHPSRLGVVRKPADMASETTFHNTLQNQNLPSGRYKPMQQNDEMSKAMKAAFDHTFREELAKAHVRDYNRISANGSLQHIMAHEDSRVQAYARKIATSKTPGELHKVRTERFGHLPHWGSLPEQTKEHILRAEDHHRKALEGFDKKKPAEKKSGDKVDQSDWRQERMFKAIQAGLFLIRKSR